MLDEGWYLMDTAALERELIRVRTGNGPPGQNLRKLTTQEALAYRDAGNVPDDLGRTLRLVLRVGSHAELRSLDEKRRAFEPDFLDAPTWRREGSKPVNVVPLRAPDVPVVGADAPWWEDPEMAALEKEWKDTGRVGGLAVPAEYRSFVYKTVVALRAAGKDVTADSVADSIARWLSPEETDRIRKALTHPR